MRMPRRGTWEAVMLRQKAGSPRRRSRDWRSAVLACCCINNAAAMAAGSESACTHMPAVIHFWQGTVLNMAALGIRPADARQRER